MGLREQKRTQRQLAILLAAADIFKQKGIEASKMEEIASAANVSAGTVYNYFPTKDELVRSLTDLYRLDVGEQRESILENPDLAPHEAFSELYRLLLDGADKYLCRDVWRYGQTVGLISSVAEARQAAWLNEMELIATQKKLLKLHVSLGNLPADTDTEALASCLHAIGFFWWLHYLGNDKMESEVTKERIAKQFKLVFDIFAPNKSSQIKDEI